MTDGRGQRAEGRGQIPDARTQIPGLPIPESFETQTLPSALWHLNLPSGIWNPESGIPQTPLSFRPARPGRLLGGGGGGLGGIGGLGLGVADNPEDGRGLERQYGRPSATLEVEGDGLGLVQEDGPGLLALAGRPLVEDDFQGRLADGGLGVVVEDLELHLVVAIEGAGADVDRLGMLRA